MKPAKNSEVDPVVEPVVNVMEDLAVNPAVNLAAGPVVNPAVDLAAGPVVNPAVDLAAGPMVNPAVDLAAGPVVKPAAGRKVRFAEDLAAGPVVKPAASPKGKFMASLKGKFAAGPVVKPATSPKGKFAAGPVVKPAASPKGKFAAGPVVKPAASPKGKFAAGPVVKPATSPKGKFAAGPVVKPATSPKGKFAAGPVVKPAASPKVRFAGDLAAGPVVKPAAGPKRRLAEDFAAGPVVKPAASPKGRFAEDLAAGPVVKPAASPKGRFAEDLAAGPVVKPAASPKVRFAEDLAAGPVVKPAASPKVRFAEDLAAGPVVKPAASPKVRFAEDLAAGPVVKPAASPKERFAGDLAAGPVVKPATGLKVRFAEDLAAGPVVKPAAGPKVRFAEDLAAGPVVKPAAGRKVRFAEDLVADPVINPQGNLPVPEYKSSTIYFTNNGTIKLYAGKKNFIHGEKYIDGVVAFDPAYVGDRKVFVRLSALFLSGRHDLQSIGLSSEAIVNQVIQQIYPPLENQAPLTKLQKKLMKNLKGKHVLPYNIQWPENFPNSVILQSSGDDENDDYEYPCGILHEIRVFVGEQLDQVQYPDFTMMEIRKVKYGLAVPGKQPMVEKTVTFLSCEGAFHIECTLDKNIYYHGETIAVNIHISNNSKHTVRKMYVSVKQSTHVFVFLPTKYKITVAEIKSEDGFKIEPGANLCRTFELTPLRSENRKKKSGLAIDGSVKSSDTNLAPTTVNADKFPGEQHGITVEYFVKVKICLSRFGRIITNRVKLPVPFVLMSKEPPLESETSSLSTPDDLSLDQSTNNPGVSNEGFIRIERDDNDNDLITEA